MTTVQRRLASYILREHFGDIVETVGSYLVQKGARSLREIIFDTKLKKEQVQKALCSLVQHKLVVHEEKKKNVLLYSLEIEKILLYLRFPRFVMAAKSLFDDTGKLIIEEIIKHGAIPMSVIVDNVVEQFKCAGLNSTESDVRKVFSNLVEGHYLYRLSQDSQGEEGSDEKMFVLPPETSGKRKRSNDSDQPAKRLKTGDGRSSQDSYEIADQGIRWSINYKRFHQLFLEQEIISAVEKKFDSVAAEIVRTMFKTDELSRDIQAVTTKPITFYEIAKSLPKNCRIENSRISQYLSLMIDDRDKLVRKQDESGGGTYVIDMKNCVTTLCQHTLQSILQERYGSNALRIFRLLLQKDHLEQKQIGELSMIPSKDAKELLYKLFSEKIINMQEVPKTADYAPSRTFYLFSVNLKQLSRMHLERCYQTQGNLMSRRQSETQDNRRLLEKQERMDATIAGLRAQHGEEAAAEAVSELEELITEADKEQLKKLKVTLDKLQQAELQVDETAFILSQYITNY
ncbi:DNA-directed RNA polymerase III subunit RPC3-like [Actinia tenebrosa]|uniref:DNA-directed RNA polymerase III subunit RPC3 n=1 Tax=Actinia tenebrosa TaxID=6105 RepID=A0A6P8IH03_ACTTE|nr:DNA-directed RNA polymerase III subunit RPC3-like [Actinia tenebrosa]